jgi:hypothetical protein
MVQEGREAVAKMSGADSSISILLHQGMMLGLGACGARGECYTQSFTWKSTAVAGQIQGSHVTLREIDGETWTAAHYKVGAGKEERAYAIAVDTFGMQYSPESYVPYSSTVRTRWVSSPRSGVALPLLLAIRF